MFMENIQKKYREIDLFDFRSILAWTFLNFLALYVSGNYYILGIQVRNLKKLV